MANVFNRGKFIALSFDMDAIDIRATLISDAYSFDVDDNFVVDLGTGAPDRLGTDYTILSEAIVEDDTNDIAYVDCADPVWNAVAGGATVHGCVMHKFVTNDSDSDVICFVDVTNTATNGGDITINIAALGFLQLT